MPDHTGPKPKEDPPLRTFTTVLLTLSLTTLSLTGCGQLAPSTGAPGATEMGARAHTNAKAMEFAQLLKAQGYKKVSVKGNRVTLTTSDFETVYDFSKTAKTGTVRVSAGEYDFEVSYVKLVETAELGEPTDILPAVLVPIAIQVAVGGAIKLAHYAITHRGDKFNKDEAIKATVEGMLTALVPVVRDVKYAQYLVPLALALITKAPSLNYKDLVATAKNMLDDIVQVIYQMLRDAKANMRAAA